MNETSATKSTFANLTPAIYNAYAFTKDVTSMFSLGLILGIMLCTALAVILLGIRDSWRKRRRAIARELRPIADQIAEIRQNSQLRVRQLERILDSHPTHADVDWVAVIISFFRRLDALASDPSPSVDEVISLAAEASVYVRKRRLKGIFVAEEARSFAAILSNQKKAA